MAEDVAQRLAAWLRRHGHERATVEVKGRATVGLSQETWFVRIGGDGADPGGDAREAVLRLPTPASGTRAILTQRAALEAVGRRVPAPALLFHDDGEDNPFGRPFLVMERVGGDVPVGWHEIPEPRRTTLAKDAMDVLAELHTIDPRPLGDGSSAGPTELDFFRRRLDRLGELPAVLVAGLWWLERHRPPPAEARVLVHGDFRMGNLIVEQDRIRGILDWEMAAPGDPLADLAWCFIPVWQLPEVDEPLLLHRYAERVGVPLDEERFHWHRVLGYVRLAYYGLAGTRAFDGGHSDDFRLAALRLQLPLHLDRLAATLAGDPIT